jgi:YegS/Rv2252/BmrU family lipid kinase
LKRKIRFIVNPKAGRGTHLPLREAVASALPAGRFESDIRVTDAIGHGEALSREAVEKGFDAVVAVGGDGTVNEVARPLLRRSVALGIVPLGSGNGLARHLRIPIGLNAALQVVAQGRQAVIDSLQVNGRFCLNIAGAGFDARVASLFAESRTRGFASYLRLVVRHYARYGETDFILRHDGQEKRRRALLVALANGAQFGNGARIAPQADSGDGLMDVVVLKKMGLAAAPAAAWRLFTGRLHGQPYWESFRTAALHMESPAPVQTHVDGEPAGEAERWDVRVEAGTHRVIVP